MHSTIFERNMPAASIIDAALQDTQHRCFWIDDTENERQTYPELLGSRSADYVVVGGGYTGLWTAVKLKTEFPTKRIVLLEAQRIGWAASGRNGGFCEASITHGDPNGEARWPNEFDTLKRLGRENLDAMQHFIEKHGLDVQWERTGSLTVANEPHQVTWLGEDGDTDTEFLDEVGVQSRINSPTFLAGEFSPHDNALVHPAKLALELARHAAAIGVEIFEHSKVVELVKEDTGVEEPEFALVTEYGAVSAARVALCTNVFPSLLKRYRFHTVPVYDYVLMTEPLTHEQLDAIGWSGREGLADMANQFHYSRLTADNRILWGGYDAVYHPGGRISAEYEDRTETFRKLASHFFTTFPQLSGLRFTHRWAGVIDTSTRFCAFYGQAHGGRVQHVAGFTGLGVGSAHFAADVIVDRFAGRVTERTELSMVQDMALPFPPEPLASIGIQSTRWAMNRADHNEGKRNLLLKTLDAVGLGFDS